MSNSEPSALAPTKEWQLANLKTLGQKLKEHADDIRLDMEDFTSDPGDLLFRDIDGHLFNIPECETSGCVVGHAPQWFPDTIVPQFFDRSESFQYETWSRYIFTSQLEPDLRYLGTIRDLWAFLFHFQHENSIEKTIIRINYVLERQSVPPSWANNEWFPVLSYVDSARHDFYEEKGYEY